MRLSRLLLCVALASALFGSSPSTLVAQSSVDQQPPGQEEFVPLSEIPAEEQIPAFTLVAAAYGAVWIVLMAYVWSVSRRLQAVESELSALARGRKS